MHCHSNDEDGDSVLFLSPKGKESSAPLSSIGSDVRKRAHNYACTCKTVCTQATSQRQLNNKSSDETNEYNGRGRGFQPSPMYVYKRRQAQVSSHCTVLQIPLYQCLVCLQCRVVRLWQCISPQLDVEPDRRSRSVPTSLR